MTWKHLARVLVAAAVCTAAAHASGQAAAELVTVVRGDACVRDGTLRPRVRARLRGHGGDAAGLEVRVDAELAGFRVLRDGEELARRRFDVLPEGCNARLDAMAITIALAIEHAVRRQQQAMETGAATAADTGTASDAASDTDTDTDTDTDAASDTDTDAASDTDTDTDTDTASDADTDTDMDSDSAGPPLGLWVHGGALALFETLPRPALGVSLGVGIRMGRRFRLGWSALFSPGSELELAGGAVDTQLWAGRFDACYGLWPGAGLSGCLGAVAGVWSATGDFTLAGRDATPAWVAVAGGLSLRWPARASFGLQAGAELLAHVLRPELLVNLGTGTGRRREEAPFPVGAVLSLGVFGTLR